MRTSARCELPQLGQRPTRPLATWENPINCSEDKTHMTNQYLLDRIAGRNSEIRAGDADRERTAERLRKSHTEGRLDLAEFQQRLSHCYEAKTLGELDELVRDLPAGDAYDERRSIGWFGPWRSGVAPFVAILTALLVISAAIGHHFFWLWIPLVFLFWRMTWSRRRRSWAAPPRGPHGWV
jgi:Domain of unknown function (DUF1707)